MKIHFTCSTAEFDTYRDHYYLIRNFLVEKGCLITRDWLPHTEERLKSGLKAIPDIKEIYKDNIRAIKEADLVIVEDTVSNFSTGHQITLALQEKKPVLVLWQGRKHRKFEQMFIHGIDSHLLQVTEYKAENLEAVLNNFINKFENINESNRFHLVLNGVERQYLDWAQFNKGKSRTQIIREALNEYMSRDFAYDAYLVNTIK